VTGWGALLVFVAGIGAGTINTVVGSGTLLTFPALLAVGLAPVTANVSNTVGLAPGSLSGAIGYRAELAGQGRRTSILATGSVLGGIIGAVLLLTLPAAAFLAIVPVLIGISLVLVIVQPWLSERLAARNGADRTEVTPALWVGVFLTGIYGGYFGAAQGILLLAIMGVLLTESLQRINGVKNVLATLANAVAAVVFVFTAEVDWVGAALVAAGAVIGGQIGARVGRRLPTGVLRAVVVIVGLTAMAKLLFWS
jgi:uncharacterized membrane protein YfcA